MAARLIAPVLDKESWGSGFDWIINELSIDHAALASEIELAKASEFLKRKNFKHAIGVYKSFEKKDKVGFAAINSMLVSFVCVCVCVLRHAA